MLAGFIHRVRCRAAARRYARQLPAQVRKDYGWSEFYSPPQIEHSAARASLPLQYIQFGYALFLDEPAFDLRRGDGISCSYADLRALLKRYTPPRVSSGFEPAAENSDARGIGGDFTQYGS